MELDVQGGAHMIHRICIVAITVPLSAYLCFVVGDRAIPFVQQWAEIAPQNPIPAQEVVVTWHGQRTRECPGTVKREIIDACHELHTLAPVPSIISEGDRPATLTRAFRIPAHIAMGPALYIASTDFVCNWTQRWWPIHSQGLPVKFNIGDASEPIHCTKTDPNLP